ncbi:hypothetical protein GDO86_000690, partial [Hymenochirus boettgeri]
MTEGDAVKVCVRLRPLIQREQGDNVNFYWKAEGSTISQIDGTKSFSFDRVFNSLETTGQVYKEIAAPIVRSALQGYNGTIFAYGQTSSGKTYTMTGTPNSLGIIPEAIQEVFKIIQEIPNREFLLRVSYMEIYNETVKDLLCDDRKKKPLEIREDINRNVYVADLTEELVMVPEHVLKWIKKGEENRHYGETKMNNHSSRSHTIFRMIVESRDRNDSANSENCDGAVMVSHLNLVDLAGSERASQTGAEGVRLKEGCNINRSLFILGQVIKRLSDGQAGGFINYRDSKLTRILQNSLGGNAKTVIICTVTPVSFDETLSTLQFASTAKHVRNTPHVNEVLDDEALLRRYRKEILDLKKQVEDLQTSSEVKVQAMAKEEHSQLLSEIKLLQKEREERIWHLTNIVVASSLESQQDQKVKRKRRVTWAPGKLHNHLHSVSAFDIPSKLTANISKRAKFSDLTSFAEIDDSFCTEFSDFDDPSSMIDNNGIENEWNSANKVTLREKTSLHQSMIDFEGQMSERVHFHDSSKESQIKCLSTECGAVECNKAFFEKEIARLQQQLQTKEVEKNEIVKGLEYKIEELDQQLQDKANKIATEPKEYCNSECQTDVKNDALQKDMSGDSGCKASSRELQDNSIDEKSIGHAECIEQRKMLELKVLDLEGFIENLKQRLNQIGQTNSYEQDFRESMQLCEVIMDEKGSALKELAILRDKYDCVLLENESLKHSLKEKNETNEFEMQEKETQQEYEAQLIHEIGSLKKLVENAELYNQNLEGELQSKVKLLTEQEMQLEELRKNADSLQKKVRNYDLSVSMGDSERLCEEVFQLKQSLCDAEAVTLDAQKECAFLRSENQELKNKMVDTSNCYKEKEKDASLFEKQLETEKANYKKMQADLQKELQSAFNEINYLNGLLSGKVPKDLLSRVELEKKIADFSKQLDKALEEKNDLQKEVTCLSEYKSLPNEVEYLKNQISKNSEELLSLKHEGEQSAAIISKQEVTLQEQSEKILTLTEEVTHTQSKLQQAETQYFDLKPIYDELYGKYTSTAEEMTQKQCETEALSTEIEQLKGAMESMEGKLTSTQDELRDALNESERFLHEREDLLNAVQTWCFTNAPSEQPTSLRIEAETSHSLPLENCQQLIALIKDRCTVHMCLEAERDNLKEQVRSLSSLVESLQNEAFEQSKIVKEKEEFEEMQKNLVSEMKQLQERFQDSQSSLEKMQMENLDVASKLQILQEEINMVVAERTKLQMDLQDLEAERDGLRQDLSENIELSIEIQDELRTTQEELKQQKQLVDDLRRQLAECILPPIKHEDTAVQEKVLLLEKKLHENETTYQLLTAERDELETTCKGLAAELELFQGKPQTGKGENSEEAQELCTPKKEKYENELSSVQENLKTENLKLTEQVEMYIQKVNELREELNLLTARECLKEGDTNVEQLQEKILAAAQEKNELLEMLGTLKAERDEMKLSLQKNIEMNSEELAEEKANKQQIQNCLAESHKKIEEQEGLLKSISENLHDTRLKYDKTIATLELVTMEKDRLAATLDSLKMTTETQKEEFHCSIAQIKQDCEKYAVQLEEERDSKLQLQCEVEEGLKKIQELESQLKDDTNYVKAVENLDAVTREREFLLLKLESLSVQLEAITNELETYKKHSDNQDQLEKTLECPTQPVNTMLTSENSPVTLEKETNTEYVEPLEEKILLLNEELHQKAYEREKLLKEKVELEEVREKLTYEVDNLKKMLANLESLQHEKKMTEDELLTLKKQMQAVSQENDGLKKAHEHLTVEMDQLKRELKENAETILYFKDEIQQKTEEKQYIANLNKELEQSQQRLKCEIEQLMITLKDKESALEDLKESEQKVIHLHKEMKAVVQEMDKLENTQRAVNADRDQLQEALRESVEMSSYLKEELSSCKTELLSIKQEKEDLNNNLSEQNKELENLSNQISPLQQQLDQLHQEVKNEKLKNYELCEKVGDLEKEIYVLRLMQNEPQQEEDEIAKRMDLLKSENEEIKVLMVKISEVYSDHHNLINGLSCELQKQNEEQKVLMSKIKESLPSTLPRSFDSLQIEQLKLNSQLGSILNKLKVVYRTAAVKEEHYSLINGYEMDLTAEQKRHDELQIQIQCLEQHGKKWSDSASDEMKFCEIEFLNQLLFKKANLIQSVNEDFSEVQAVLSSVSSALQEEIEHKRGFLLSLAEIELNSVNKISEKVQQENKRISGTIQLLTKKLKAAVQSKLKREMTAYLNQFEFNLQEKKEQNKELLRRIEHLTPNANIIEEENARLLKKLKAVQDESKTMQSRIQMMESELNLAKTEARKSEQKLAMLQNKFLASTTESELQEMKAKLAETQNILQTSLKEIQTLQERVAKGAAPYREEIDNLKTKVVKIEMEKIKLSKASDQEIASLKSCLDDKEEYLRKLKEELRRAQADSDTTVCVAKDYPKTTSFPLTCGGGSGIVQSTAILVLQSEKAALERELSHYKKKYSHISRNMSSQEEDSKKTKRNLSDSQSSHAEASCSVSPQKTEMYRKSNISPRRTEMPRLYEGSPRKSGVVKKRTLSPIKTVIDKKHAVSPSRSDISRHLMSPGKTGLNKHLKSPYSTYDPLHSVLTSPCKRQNVQENLGSPQSKFFGSKSKSLPYCPSQFFDNSKLGAFSGNLSM